MAAAAPGLRQPPSCGLRQARARATGRRWGREKPARAPVGERCVRLPRARAEGPGTASASLLAAGKSRALAHRQSEESGGEEGCREPRVGVRGTLRQHRHRNLEREEESLRRPGRREGGKAGVGGTFK